MKNGQALSCRFSSVFITVTCINTKSSPEEMGELKGTRLVPAGAVILVEGLGWHALRHAIFLHSNYDSPPTTILPYTPLYTGVLSVPWSRQRNWLVYNFPKKNFFITTSTLPLCDVYTKMYFLQYLLNAVVLFKHILKIKILSSILF